MAKFEVSGIDDVLNKITSYDTAVSSTIPKMLKAGADVLVKQQQAEIRNTFNSDRSTGDLAASIKASSVKGGDDEKYIEVSPQGTNSKGERNATVGFVQQYGRSNMAARPWMTAANAKAANAVSKAMLDEWEAGRGGK